MKKGNIKLRNIAYDLIGTENLEKPLVFSINQKKVELMITCDNIDNAIAAYYENSHYHNSENYSFENYFYKYLVRLASQQFFTESIFLVSNCQGKIVFEAYYSSDGTYADCLSVYSNYISYTSFDIVNKPKFLRE